MDIAEFLQQMAAQQQQQAQQAQSTGNNMQELLQRIDAQNQAMAQLTQVAVELANRVQQVETAQATMPQNRARDVKLLMPERFDGRKRDEYAQAWLYGLRKYKQGKNMADAEANARLLTLLKDSALTWFRMHEQIAERDNVGCVARGEQPLQLGMGRWRI